MPIARAGAHFPQEMKTNKLTTHTTIKKKKIGKKQKEEKSIKIKKATLETYVDPLNAQSRTCKHAPFLVQNSEREFENIHREQRRGGVKGEHVLVRALMHVTLPFRTVP